MNFIKTPLEINSSGYSSIISRNIEDVVTMLDNLIELIVCTPKGSFSADPDFGFEYWNHEYSNIHFRDFNNSHTDMGEFGSLCNDVTQKECQISILNSLETYGPQLKHIDVSIELNSIDENKQTKKSRVFSKYEVSVRVTGFLDDGLGIIKPYEKRISFFMEPTVKQISI